MRDLPQVGTVGQQREPLEAANEDPLARQRPQGHDLRRRRPQAGQDLHPLPPVSVQERHQGLTDRTRPRRRPPSLIAGPRSRSSILHAQAHSGACRYGYYERQQPHSNAGEYPCRDLTPVPAGVEERGDHASDKQGHDQSPHGHDAQGDPADRGPEEGALEVAFALHGQPSKGVEFWSRTGHRSAPPLGFRVRIWCRSLFSPPCIPP